MPSVKNADKRMDRRVMRTRKAIMNAFDKLVVSGNTDKITVSAIAREADIDRKTFYLHYKSIDDLAMQKTEEAFEHIFETLKAKGGGKNYLERVHIVLAEVNAMLMANLPLYSSLAARTSIDQVLAHFERAAEPMLSHAGMNPEFARNGRLHMTLQFFLAGAISLYATWLRSDHSQPIETVSNTIEEALSTLYAIPTDDGLDYL